MVWIVRHRLRAQTLVLVTTLMTLSCSVSGIELGFYNPTGINPAFASEVDFAMIEVINEAQVLKALEDAGDAGLSVTLNIGPVITESIPAVELNRTYHDHTGKLRTKRFAPKPLHKIKRFLPDDRIRQIADRLALGIHQYPNVIDTVFLIDEPYLKGVPPEEIDRVATLIRDQLEAHSIVHLKFGVVFASLTYDPEFADMLTQQASAYAARADDRFDSEQQRIGAQVLSMFGLEPSWVAGFAQDRLVTYDQAGNLYVDGGLPKLLDVIGFNFYISTLLLDDLYAKAPDWFAKNYPSTACDGFRGQRISNLRESLSFFGDGSANTSSGTCQPQMDSLFQVNSQFPRAA
jgi:hypothetical protein